MMSIEKYNDMSYNLLRDHIGVATNGQRYPENRFPAHLSVSGYNLRKTQMNQKEAYWRVSNAVRNGQIEKLKTCQLCGLNCKHTRIHAHHWRGYDYPLDVWWACNHCNSQLYGRHDGKMNIAQARDYLRSTSVTFGLCEGCHNEARAGLPKNAGIVLPY